MRRIEPYILRVLCALACALAAVPSEGQDSAQGVRSPVTPAELVELRGLSGLAVSPDSAFAVVRVDRQDIGTDRTYLQWQVVRLADGRVVTTADGGEPLWNVNGYIAPETAQWSPDSQSIYYRKLQNQEVQLWRADAKTGRSKRLTNDLSDVQAFVVSDNRSVHYAVGPATRSAIVAAEAAEHDSGVLLDGSVIAGFPVVRGFPVNGRMATYRHTPSASNWGRATLLGEVPLHIKSLDTYQRASTPAPHAWDNKFGALWREANGGFLPFDPSKQVRATSPSGEQVAHVIASLGGTKAQPHPRLSIETGSSSIECSNPVCEDADQIEIVGWTTDGADLIFQTQALGSVRLNAWNISSGRGRVIFHTEGVLGSQSSGSVGACQIGRSEAVCITSEADTPPRLVGINLVSGGMRVLLDPNSALAPDRLGRAEKISLADRFGSVTIGRLILPQTLRVGERLPLVITSYNCDGFLSGGSGRDVPEHVLAFLGYAALCIDEGAQTVRRPVGFVWTPANSQQSGLDFFEDAIRILNERGIIDPQRVSLNGFSGSATDTTYAIAKSRKFTAAAITTSGSLDAMACYVGAQYRSCADWSRREGYSGPYDSRNGVLKDSPAWNADRIVTPLLMQLPEVEYVSMLQLYSAMLEAGRAVEMYIFADAYHYKNRPRQRLAVYERNIDWINFWLRGIDRTGPLHAAENTRWKAMRASQCGLFVGQGAFDNPPWYCAR